MPKKLAGLDHLRALAIVLVFLYHYNLFNHPEWTETFGGFGWTGVDLFFVLSGFLISSQLFTSIKKGTGLQLKEFYIKRSFRILPAYLFILALYFIIPAFRERPGLPPLWKFLTFTQNLGLDLRQTKAFSHAWSLCIEEQFYLLLPFTLLAFSKMKMLRFGGVLILLLIIGGMLARLFCWQQYLEPAIGDPGIGAIWYKFIYYPTYARLEGLLTGVTIAAIFVFKPALKEVLTKRSNLILLTGLALLTAAYFVCEEQLSFSATIIGFLLVSLGYGGLVAAAVSPANFLYRWPSRITARLATLSYAIYLSHKAIVHLTQEWLSAQIDKSGTTMFFICTITSLLGGLLLHYTIEKPFMKLRTLILRSKDISQAS
ncbi:MAG: acyltransferase [Citrobacter freundii]|nr:MAG: acyltransferase [Citrobacter freundii]